MRQNSMKYFGGNYENLQKTLTERHTVWSNFIFFKGQKVSDFVLQFIHFKKQALDLNFIHELECKNLIITNIPILDFIKINSLYYNDNTDEKVHIIQPYLLNLYE